jgi:hypothetical protein
MVYNIDEIKKEGFTMTKIYTYGTKIFTDENELKNECMKKFLWRKNELCPNFNEPTTPIKEKIEKINDTTIRHTFTFKTYTLGHWMKKQFSYLEKTIDN